MKVVVSVERRVVFVHGGAVDQRSWELVAGRLGEKWRIALPSRPTVDEIIDLLDRGSVLVGASMGGGLALEAAARRPELVERLVLVAPLVPIAPVAFPDARLQRFADAASEGPAAFAAAVLDDPWFSAGLSDRTAREALRVIVEDNAPGRPEQAPWPAPELTTEALTAIRAPTAILLGDLDDPANAAMSRWTAQHIAQARLQLVPRAGHVVELIRPDVVAAAIDPPDDDAAAASDRSWSGH